MFRSGVAQSGNRCTVVCAWRQTGNGTENGLECPNITFAITFYVNRNLNESNFKNLSCMIAQPRINRQLRKNDCKKKYRKQNWQSEWIHHSLVHVMHDETQCDNCTNVTTEIVNEPAFRLHIASSTFDCARTHPYNHIERTHADEHTLTQPQTQYASARAMRHFTSLHTHSPTNMFCTNTTHSDRPEINRNEHSAAICDNAISPTTKE